MNIFVTGACGYKGSVLVPKLLAAGHDVVAFDIMWFGNQLLATPNLTVIRGDIRDTESIDLSGIDAIIHLASIANDPCGDLDPKLTWEVSALATMRLAESARRHGVARFIYASSGSVYGVKSDPQVTEDLSLEPISEYNKTKMVAERVVLSYANDMVVQIVRPATVCGPSPRMRFDVSVNMLTIQAMSNGRITVFGGDQVRPNIHIDDITDAYLFFLKNPQHTGIYNAGFENLSINQIAEMVIQYVPAEIVITPSNDPRSYRVNSDRLRATGFSPRKSVDHAIREIVDLVRSGELQDQPRWHKSSLDAGDRSGMNAGGDWTADYPKRLAAVMSDADWSQVATLGELLLECWRDGRQVFICGNGGSAANAVHLANDLLYGIARESGLGLRVSALPANTSVLTCLGNDCGYEHIFGHQLRVMGAAGDILIVLSGSGNSPNILVALKVARELKMKSFAILGFAGGQAKDLADGSMHFAVDDMQIAEDMQMIVGHMIMQFLYRRRQNVRSQGHQ